MMISSSNSFVGPFSRKPKIVFFIHIPKRIPQREIIIKAKQRLERDKKKRELLLICVHSFWLDVNTLMVERSKIAVLPCHGQFIDDKLMSNKGGGSCEVLPKCCKVMEPLLRPVHTLLKLWGICIYVYTVTGSKWRLCHGDRCLHSRYCY